MLQTILKMLTKFTFADKLLFLASFLAIIFSKLLYWQGAKIDAIFVGLCAPSILAFGIYLKLLGASKDE